MEDDERGFEDGSVGELAGTATKEQRGRIKESRPARKERKTVDDGQG